MPAPAGWRSTTYATMEDARFWRMRVRAQAVRPPLPRAQAALERFARRAEGEARVEMSETGLELTVLLPRVAQ